MNEIDEVKAFINSNNFELMKKYWFELNQERSKFDFIELFQDMFNENSWSKILQFLLHSKNNHNLKQEFLREWLANIDNKKVHEFSRRLPEVEMSDSIAIREWTTEENRRVDIVIHVRDNKKNTHSILAIENKLFSNESENQLSDYQKALCDYLPKCKNKILLYLTPDGVDGTTVNTETDVVCVPVSYSSIRNSCINMINDNNHEFVKPLLNNICLHIDKMTKQSKTNKEISDFVKKIYKEKTNREVIKLLIDNLPSITQVFNALEDRYTKSKRFMPLKYEGSKSTEFKLHTTNLDKKTEKLKIGFCYMLHFDGKNPDIDNKFVLRLMIYFDESLKNNKNEIKRIVEHFTFGESIEKKKDWWKWKTIWTGDSYSLQDYDKKDIQGLMDLLEEGINFTYDKLLRKINNYLKTTANKGYR